MVLATAPRYDPATDDFFSLIGRLTGPRSMRYTSLMRRYIEKGALTWVRFLQRPENRPMYTVLLDLMHMFLSVGDIVGAEKTMYPLTRYVVDELERRGSRITVHEGRALVWGDHSSGRPYEVSLVPQGNPLENRHMTCTCQRFLGTNEFKDTPGVCSHIVLVALMVAARGLRGLASRQHVDGDPSSDLLGLVFMNIARSRALHDDSVGDGLPDEL